MILANFFLIGIVHACIFLSYSLCGASGGLWLNPRYCMNGDKPVSHCLHSQSGLCEIVNSSQPCIASERFSESDKVSY